MHVLVAGLSLMPLVSRELRFGLRSLRW